MYLALNILLPIAIAADLIGNLTFLRSYFAFGIPAYRASLPFDAPLPPVALARYLTDQTRSEPLPSLTFRRLSDSEIGFREKISHWGFKVGYFPVMHGIVQFSRVEHATVITGRLNWTPLVAIAQFLSTAWGEPLSFALPFVSTLLLAIGVSYALQASRY